jgi:hypothetical protein
VQTWRDKYLYNFWRPIIGIRYASLDTMAGTGPFEDMQWRPLGAPRTNQNLPGVTPGFPAYPSGHATIGTAAFEVARQVLKIPPTKTFTMISDEYDGKNQGEGGVPRPRITRELTVDAAIEENKRSRVYLGVHWAFDTTNGADLGAAIANNIVQNFPNKA